MTRTSRGQHPGCGCGELTSQIKTELNQNAQPAEKAEDVCARGVCSKVTGDIHDAEEEEGRTRGKRYKRSMRLVADVACNRVQALQPLRPSKAAKHHAVIAAEHWRLPSAVDCHTQIVREMLRALQVSTASVPHPQMK